MIEIVGWLGFIFILFGYYLNAKQNIICFFVWGLGNLLLLYYAFTINSMPQTAVAGMVLIMNFYGYKQWKR
jgi:hypothetical protein